MNGTIGAGDKVRLKCGGPPMAVDGLEGNLAYVWYWNAAGVLASEEVPVSVLALADESTEGTGGGSSDLPPASPPRDGAGDRGGGLPGDGPPPPEHDEMAEAVERGAKVLDEKLPGWAGRIDLERLEMADDSDDVLGCLAGDVISRGEIERHLGERFAAREDHYGIRLGALVGNYGRLTALWKAAIAARTSPRPSDSGELPSHPEHDERAVQEAGARLGKLGLSACEMAPDSGCAGQWRAWIYRCPGSRVEVFAPTLSAAILALDEEVRAEGLYGEKPRPEPDEAILAHEPGPEDRVRELMRSWHFDEAYIQVIVHRLLRDRDIECFATVAPSGREQILAAWKGEAPR